MICPNCGADFPSDKLRCPYCNSVNEHALKLAKELQEYDKDYEEAREDLLENSNTIVLKKLTISVSIAFLVVILLFGGFVIFYNYRYGDTSKYNVTGDRYTKNKARVEKYLNEGQYIRAYLVAANTDPTHEYFQYYPEHADELNAIYNYSLILSDVRRTMEDMDDGNNYRAFEDTLAISYSIFYGVPQSDIKDELEIELDDYLRNLYRLTEDEIIEFKRVAGHGGFISTDFKIEGSTDYPSITKERMVEYFGK